MSTDVIAFDGFEVRVDFDRWPAKILRALLRRHYEKHELRLISRLLEPADRMIELGSAIGVVALAASRIVPPERISCFDANPDMVAEATTNFALNGKPITVENAVLVANEGGPPGASFYKTPYFLSSSLSAETTGATPIEVPTRSLPGAIMERNANVLIVDIEGGEFDLLGAADLDAIDKLVLEIHVPIDGVPACLRLISDLQRQRLMLDESLCAYNVFVFTRGATGAKPSRFAEAYLSGLEKWETGDAVGASTALTDAIGENPCNAYPQLLLSQIMLKRGDRETALYHALAAAKLDPRNEDTFEQLGVLHSAHGALEQAEAAYRTAIELTPRRPLFHAGLGAAQASQGRSDEALSAFETAASMVPDRAREFDHLLDLAIRQDKTPGDITSDMPREALRGIDPDRFFRRLGKVVKDSFRFPDAAGALARAVELNPGDQSLHCALAALVATPKDIRKALKPAH